MIPDLTNITYFGKPVIFGCCRNCQHYHHTGTYCDNTFEYVDSALGCRCNDWAPLDNLDFLQYKYEKQNKI